MTLVQKLKKIQTKKKTLKEQLQNLVIEEAHLKEEIKKEKLAVPEMQGPGRTSIEM